MINYFIRFGEFMVESEDTIVFYKIEIKGTLKVNSWRFPESEAKSELNKMFRDYDFQIKEIKAFK